MDEKQELEELYQQYQYVVSDFGSFLELVRGRTKQECVLLLQQITIGLIQEGNKEIRTRFVEQNLGLILSTAKKLMEYRSLMDGNFIEMEDLCQVGYLEFEHCLDRYDIERGTMFSTYVVTSMQHRMQTYLRDQTCPLYVSQYQYEKGLSEQPYTYVSLDRYIQEDQANRMEELYGVDDCSEEQVMKRLDVFRTIKQVASSMTEIEREFFLWHYVYDLPSGQFQYRHKFTSNKVAKLKRQLHQKLVTAPEMEHLRGAYLMSGENVSNGKVKTK